MSAVGQGCHDGLSLKCDTAKKCPSSAVLRKGAVALGLLGGQGCGDELFILSEQPAADPDLQRALLGWGHRGDFGGTLNNGKPLSGAGITFWQPPAHSILIC